MDLLQVHDIEFGNREQVLNEAIPAALKAKEQGKTRYVGFSGLPVRYLAQIARQVNVDTVLSWGHYTLLDDEINDELVPLAQQKGFGLMNAAPLMQRILSDSAVPVWQSSPQPVKGFTARAQPVVPGVWGSSERCSPAFRPRPPRHCHDYHRHVGAAAGGTECARAGFPNPRRTAGPYRSHGGPGQKLDVV